jgi:isocitrate/isopropylmalate dehydrogenase
MRKPTPGKSVFLAGTLTIPLLATAEIVPNVIQGLREDAHHASEELKRKNSANPADTFTAGIIIGLVGGAVTATKVISDKINNP